MSRSEYIQSRFDLTGTESELVLVPPFNIPSKPEPAAQPLIQPEQPAIKQKVRSFKKFRKFRAPNSTKPGNKWVVAQEEFKAVKQEFDPVEKLTRYELVNPVLVYYDLGNGIKGYQTLRENSPIWTHARANRKKR